jgi:hypothetical protein
MRWAADALGWLARVLSARGAHDSARATAARAHAAFLGRVGPTHRSTLEALRTLAVVAAARHDHEAAETLLIRAYDGLRGLLGADHPATRQTGRDLVGLYEAWGRPGKADAYRPRAG